jgi:hypothetical protein
MLLKFGVLFQQLFFYLLIAIKKKKPSIWFFFNRKFILNLRIQKQKQYNNSIRIKYNIFHILDEGLSWSRSYGRINALLFMLSVAPLLGQQTLDQSVFEPNTNFRAGYKPTEASQINSSTEHVFTVPFRQL